MTSGNSTLIIQRTLSGMGCFPSHEPIPKKVGKQKNKRTCFLCHREAQKDNLLCSVHRKEGYEAVRVSSKAIELSMPLNKLSFR